MVHYIKKSQTFQSCKNFLKEYPLLYRDYKKSNLIILFSVSIHCFCSGTELSLKKDAPAKRKTSLSVYKEDGYNKSTPQARGVILKFYNWPNSNEQTLINERAQKQDLKAKVEIQRFNVWVFEWTKLDKAARVKSVCKDFSDISSLKSCEPDYLATFSADNTISIKTGTLSHVDDSLKNCHIVSSDLSLFEGQLSDYWAQEAIGADLLKEKLKNLNPVEKHLIELFDIDEDGHSVGVKNLVSSDGKQSVLPELNDKLRTHHTPYSSDLLTAVDRLLNKADNECINVTINDDNSRNIASSNNTNSGGGGSETGTNQENTKEETNWLGNLWNNLFHSNENKSLQEDSDSTQSFGGGEQNPPSPSPSPQPPPTLAPQPPAPKPQPPATPPTQPPAPSSALPPPAPSPSSVQEENPVSEDLLPLSDDDLKYVKRSELGYMRDLIKKTPHKSNRDMYMGWVKQLIDSRRVCHKAYHDMYNGIEKTFRIYQGNLDWVKKNGITGMTVTHMKLQGKSLMDIRNTATPEEIEAKIAQVQEHIDNMKKEALRLASANGIRDYSVIQKPETGKVPGVKEYVRLSQMSRRIAVPWRTYQEKRSRLSSLEPQTRARKSNYPLPNDWGDIPFDE